MNTISDDLQDFFFEAAAATYAGTASKTTIDGLPGSKTYRHERGEYLYIDTYFTNGEQSGGLTMIYTNYGKTPAWLMSYQGWCKDDDKGVLNFLKQVLASTYQSKIFYGGRGRQFIQSGDRSLKYSNHCYGTFDLFNGEEDIERNADDRMKGIDRIFWHKYQGMTLLQEVQSQD